jgi:hypothetical protein
VSGDGGGAGVRAGEGGQDVDGGGLAGAVGAEDAEELAAVDGEAEVVEGVDGAVTGAVGLRDVVEHDDRVVGVVRHGNSRRSRGGPVTVKGSAG